VSQPQIDSKKCALVKMAPVANVLICRQEKWDNVGVHKVRNLLSAQRDVRGQIETIMARPQTTKTGMLTHRDRKLIHLKFKPGGKQPPTIDTDCTSFRTSYRNSTLSPGGFFKETARVLSDVFRNDTTSMTIKSFLGRRNSREVLTTMH
jgi:hypothetical protein